MCGEMIDDAMTTTEAKAKMVSGLTTISTFLQLMACVRVCVCVCVCVHATCVLPVPRLDEISHSRQVDRHCSGIY